jgi:serine/threonine protein kinase
MAALATMTRTPAAVSSAGFGTLRHMAPEQLDGVPGDHRADIFAFGWLYEMLAGRKAFEADGFAAIAAIMTADPPPIAAIQTAHPLLDHVPRRCLRRIVSGAGSRFATSPPSCAGSSTT